LTLLIVAVDVIHGNSDSYEKRLDSKESDKHYDKVTEQALKLNKQYNESKYAKLTCRPPPPAVELTKKKHMPGFGKQARFA